VFALFDRAALDEATAAGVARYKHAIPGSSKRQSPHWNADIVDQMVADGRVMSGASVSELAASLGVPAANIEGTVAHYNAGVAQGCDREYLKDAAFLEPIASPPFYGAELRPATVASTACGLRIDPDARVRGTDGTPIGGLFAAGECTGGVVGAQYVGSGNNYANCIVLGRVAGASAAAFASGSAPEVTS
jgi:fumarate reductase flavoprotein subunit